MSSPSPAFHRPEAAGLLRITRTTAKSRAWRRLTRARTAFSLLEVVAAVAIFSVGMVAVIALFAPVTKSVAGVADAEAAAGVADAVRARVQGLPFDSALKLIQLPADVRKNDGNGNYNPNDGTHPAVLFGKPGGDIGIYDPATGRKAWYDSTVPTPQRVADADKFFEIDLIRNDAISPAGGDATAAMVAYFIRVRWPAFTATGPGTAVQTGQTTGGSVPFDQSKKQVMFFTGAVMR